MQIDVWHGTNQDFDRFDENLLGLNNANTASRAAFFFAADPETARDYARQAARKLVPNHIAHENRVERLLIEAEAAREAGQLNSYEELLMEAEELEFGAIQAEPEGAKILRCRVTIINLLEIDGSQYSVICNLGDVLETARANGYDAVILRGISDTPSGTIAPDDHYAVFSADQIEIIDVMSVDAALETHPEKLEEDLLDMAM